MTEGSNEPSRGPAPRPYPWPAGASFTADGMRIQGLPAEHLATRYGTPLLVIDEDDMRARFQAYAAVFPRVFFAVKALTTRLTIRAAIESGVGLLCSTGGEMDACLRAGAPAASLVLHGNNKSAAELELAVRAGVSAIVADNVDELLALAGLTRGRSGATAPRVILRVNPGVEADTHDYLDTGGLDSKFGTPIDAGRALDALRIGHELFGGAMAGIHAHVGSQLFDPALLLATVDILLDLLAQAHASFGYRATVLDVGGGFGVTYRNERPASPDAMAAAVLGRVAQGAASRKLDLPEVIVEPGRSLVANPGCTLYRVGAVKEDATGRLLVAVDGGMSDNIRPALYGAEYEVAFASSVAPSRAPVTATIVGKHCESGDILARDISLPAAPAVGQLLAFAATGAYTYPMASNYNRVGRPAIVAVRGGADRLTVRREDFADLDRLDVESAGPVPQVQPPAGVSIRAARPRDAKAFHHMWKEVVAEGWLRTRELRDPVRTYKRLFADSWNGNGAWILAVHDDDILGLVSLTREAYPATRHVASLGIGVAISARRRGIAAALMSEAFRWAEGVGVKRLILSVYPDNIPAVTLYRRFGFIEEGRFLQHSLRQNGYGDEILMGRWVG